MSKTAWSLLSWWIVHRVQLLLVLTWVTSCNTALSRLPVFYFWSCKCSLVFLIVFSSLADLPPPPSSCTGEHIFALIKVFTRLPMEQTFWIYSRTSQPVRASTRVDTPPLRHVMYESVNLAHKHPGRSTAIYTPLRVTHYNTSRTRFKRWPWARQHFHKRAILSTKSCYFWL